MEYAWEYNDIHLHFLKAVLRIFDTVLGSHLIIYKDVHISYHFIRNIYACVFHHPR